MKIAIISSNFHPLSKETIKGTEIFVYQLINELSKRQGLDLTVFASGDSSLPSKVESVATDSSSADRKLAQDGKHIIFELAIISKAVSMQERYDLFHVNIGNGDIAIPFARFTDKPVLITLHYTIEASYMKKFFDIFSDLNNVYFVALSEAQKRLIPHLNYADVIPHGIDAKNTFTFDGVGGDGIMWAGRAVPEKGLEDVIRLAENLKTETRLFILTSEERKSWFTENVVKQIEQGLKELVRYELNTPRQNLVPHFQSSKLFLFPITWEEPFGLVLIEAMSCGTPIVAYAKGSVPEIVEDGVTGFIVNQSDQDIRGNWIVKKTGIEGLMEAVGRIYSMTKEEYLTMRKNCRARVEKHYTVETMADRYTKLYKNLVHSANDHEKKK